MRTSGYSQTFVTDKRIAFAVRLADDIAARDHSLSAFDCADRAVRRIFGRWLLDRTGSVPAANLPLHYRLVDEVEQRLGLHRRRPHSVPPPAMLAAAAGSASIA